MLHGENLYIVCSFYHRATFIYKSFLMGSFKVQSQFYALWLTVVYRKPKYSAETEYFHYLAFGFGHRNFILDILPLVLS